jgi:PHP family Zn ribbon phosphoesterase
MAEKFYYDLHIHSCLSPCGDEDMTPNNIAGMAVLKGLNVLALTDHNTCKNCPAFFEACKKQGLVAIAGAEVTTAEDVHMICLFRTLDDAMAFDRDLQEYRILIKNNEEVFGSQLVMDGNDNVVGREEHLLVNATTLDIETLFDFARRYRAIVYPAHIDRDANGIIAILGTIPPTPVFSCFEVRDADTITEYKEKYGLSNKLFVANSDSHYLTDINETNNFFELDVASDSPDEIRKALFKLLNGYEGNFT